MDLEIQDIDKLPPNFPRKPSTTKSFILQHPSDLILAGRSFYTQMQFVPYRSLQPIVLGWNGAANPVGGVVLPVPLKINDTQTVIWEPLSGLAAISSLISYSGAWSSIGYLQMLQQAVGGIVSGVTGIQANPFLWQVFKHPEPKEFTLQWILIANNPAESLTITNIIDHLKFHSLPGTGLWGLTYDYPDVLLIKLYPNNKFTVRFKPCVVVAVQADYTSGGVPSFHKNGAPTLITLTMQVRELELWTKTNYWE
jgi:hypothetical protein